MYSYSALNTTACQTSLLLFNTKQIDKLSM